MKEQLFAPLNMLSCGFGALGDPNSSTPDQPWAHIRTGNGVIPIFADNPATLGPSATVHCTMQDWSKFIAIHLRGFKGKPEILTAESYLKLHTAYPGQEYTYGGWIRSSRQWANGVVFAHDGSNTLNYSTVWWAPNRNLAVMSVSNIGAPEGQIAAYEALIPLLQEAN